MLLSAAVLHVRPLPAVAVVVVAVVIDGSPSSPIEGYRLSSSALLLLPDFTVLPGPD